MTDSDKIVAAILAVGYSLKNGGMVNPADFVGQYVEMLDELRKREAVTGFGEKLEKAIEKRKSGKP